MELSPGTLFANRFRIQHLAGRGGMGAVYRAFDIALGQPVALKLLAELGSPHEAERFAQEGQILAGLHHPHIVSYIARGRADSGQSFLAMEWLDGEDLASRLKRGPLSAAETVTLLTCVAEALAVAHGGGLLHRDLKPANLFLREGKVERLALLDFGIALPGGRAQALTGTGVILGTPEYMAPEQARAVRTLTPASDIFALGCIVFECLTGTPPFRGEQIAAVLAKILFDEPPSLCGLRPETPPTLARLVMRMLAKDPLLRPPDAQALRKELQAHGPLLIETVAAGSALRPTASRVQLGRVESDQQLVSVLIATLGPVGADQATLASAPGGEQEARGALLCRVLAENGLQVESLADGSLVAAVAAGFGAGAMLSAATDVATLAAGSALLVRQHWPAARIALATGRGPRSAPLSIGDALDRASRLLLPKEAATAGRTAASGGGQIRLDEVTAGLLDGRFRIQHGDGGTYELLGEDPLASDASRLLLGKPTPCVGREQELGTLELLLRACIDDPSPGMMLVIAAPGAGKSRLRHEFVRRVAAQGPPILVLYGGGDPRNTGSPYGLLSQALRTLGGIVDGEPPGQQQEKLRVLSGGPGAEPARIAEFLGELCSVPFADEASPKLRAARQNPHIMSDQIRQAFYEWLRATCRVQPVLLILEDLHWCDALTIKLVSEAPGELAELPFLLLALARPEVEVRFPKLWTGKAQTLRLRPLPKKACERLVHHMLGPDTAVDVVARIIEQAAGNTLFLEYLIRAVASGQSTELPRSVLAMLQARLATLAPRFCQVLCAASVQGVTFWRGGVLALLGEAWTSGEVDAVLEALVAEELIHPQRTSRFMHEVEYSFRHALLRDAAYGLLTPENCTLGHRLTAAFCEEVGERDSAIIAVHYQQGGDEARAVQLFARAAEQSYARDDLEGALRLAEQSLRCGADGELKGRMLAIQTMAHGLRWDLEPARVSGSVALTLLPPGDPWWCQVAGGLAAIYGLSGQRAAATELADRLVVQEPTASNLSSFTEGAGRAAGAFCILGWHELARAMMEKLQRCRSELTEDADLVSGAVDLAASDYARSLGSDPWAPRVFAERAAVALQRAGDRRRALFARTFFGQADGDLGEHARGEHTLRECLSLARQMGTSFENALVKLHLADLLVGTARPSACAEAAELATEQLQTHGLSPGYQGWAHHILARDFIRRGELTAAEAALRTALPLVRLVPVRSLLISSVLAGVMRAQGQVAAARATAEAALAKLTELGGAGYAAVPVRLEVVEVRAADGDVDGARQALAACVAELQRRSGCIPDATWRGSYLGLPLHQHVLQLAAAWKEERS